MKRAGTARRRPGAPLALALAAVLGASGSGGVLAPRSAAAAEGSSEQPSGARRSAERIPAYESPVLSLLLLPFHLLIEMASVFGGERHGEADERPATGLPAPNP